jgi:transcription elongation factor GreA
MTVRKQYLITAEGLQRVEAELEQLRTVKRPLLAERLHRAMEDGQDDDFVDNAELEAARNEQSFLEGRINELKDIIRYAEIIQEDTTPHDIVQIGDYVTVIEDGYDEEERYHLVGAAEADPDAGRISNESPLGAVLLGAKLNSTVTVAAPRGEVKFKVVKVE